MYAASPVASDERIFLANDAGTVVVIKAGDTLEVLSRNPLGEQLLATPAIAANTLFIRTSRNLWAFAQSKP
jgi:hypothetical protein